MHVIKCYGAKDDAVIEKDDDGPDPPGDAQSHCEKRHLRVVRHQHGGKRAFLALKPVVFRGFLFLDAVRGALHQALKRHDAFFRVGVEFQRRGSKDAPCYGDGERDPKRRDAAPKRSRKRSCEPAPYAQLAISPAAGMDFAVCARNNTFEVTAEFDFAGECRELCQIGRAALIQLVKLEHLPQLEPVRHVSLQFAEHRFQTLPVRTLLRDEALQVDDHINCLCLMPAYSEASCTPALALSSIAKCTPMRS